MIVASTAKATIPVISSSVAIVPVVVIATFVAKYGVKEVLHRRVALCWVVWCQRLSLAHFSFSPSVSFSSSCRRCVCARLRTSVHGPQEHPRKRHRLPVDQRSNRTTACFVCVSEIR